MSDTLSLIHQRRSVRSFQDKSIDEKIKADIIDAAMRSPTAGNMMLYSVLEVADQSVKEQLVKSCDNQPFIAKAPLVLLFLADYQRWFDYFQICDVEGLCRDESKHMRKPSQGDLMLACCDALIAAQTAVIAAESLGVGSCYIGDIMENYEFHKKLFKLPTYTFPITMLCLGYPTKSATERKLTSRFSKENILHENVYNRLDESELLNMFEMSKPKSYLGNAQNTGQHYYLKKFGADFSIEMNRSVKQAVKSWTEGEDS